MFFLTICFLFADYSCALVGDILLQGHLYITKNYFAFYSNVFGYVTKVRLQFDGIIRSELVNVN